MHSDGTTEDWTSHGTNMPLYYLLNDGSHELGDLLEGLDPKDFYFRTEALCHAHMAIYYRKHNVEYPYTDEWLACSTDAALGIRPAGESQIMEFA